MAQPVVTREPQAPLALSVRDRRVRIRTTRELPPATFTLGWPPDLDRCPRCGGLLAREPAYHHCQFGCGRLWPIRGARIIDQREYEHASGLAVETTAVDGRTTAQFATRHAGGRPMVRATRDP